MTSRYEEMMKTKKFQPFHIGHLTEDLKIRAEKELNETDETRGPALAKLREKIIGEKKFHCKTDDAYLLQFLRARKFNIDRAFSLLQHKYQTKKSYSDIYDKCNLDSVRALINTGPTFCLPYRDEDGCIVLFFQMAKWNPSDYSIVNVLTGMTILILYCVEDPATQVCGVRVVMDVQGASLRQLRCLTPRYIQLFSKALRNSLPCRFKGIHIYNESTIFQYIWSILKIFLTEKINKRVHFHGDNQKNLHKFIPKAILTADYGGDNTDFCAKAWCRKELSGFYKTFEVILDSGYED